MKVILRVQIKTSPLTKIVKKYCKQRETSSDEDDIPLMELAKRMQGKGNKYKDDKLGNDDTSAEDQSLLMK